MAVQTTHPGGRQLSDNQLFTLTRTNQPRWFGWPGYVVPTSMLAPVLFSYKKELNGSTTNSDHTTGEENGWLNVLAQGSAGHARVTRDSAIRRLYDVLNNRTRIVSAEYAEAFLMTCGISLDRDTDIPTLPGNKNSALDLLYVRAKSLDPKVKVRDVIPLIPVVIQLSVAILETPELTPQLQDDAPFNCLRPWRYM